MLACYPPRGGNSLAWRCRNKTILYIIISQQKFTIFALEAFRKNQKNRPYWYQLTTVSGKINQGDPNLSLQPYWGPGDGLGHVFFDNTVFFSIRRKYVLFGTYYHSTGGQKGHNSPIYDECQLQSAWVLALPWKRAHQDDSNDTPQPICEFQVGFPLRTVD